MMIEGIAGPSRLIARRIVRRSPTCHRFQSTQSSKITAAPFLLPPSSAAYKLHMNGLLATAKMSNLILSGLMKVFGPAIVPLAKQFGLGSTLKMRDMKAVYWPAWRVDALLEGSVENGKEDKAWLGVQEGYIPGNSFAPLSYLSFAVPPLPDDLPQYEPKEHLEQLGVGYDIVAVPFTVSPFAVMDRGRKVIGRRGKFEEMIIDETKWKEIMTACYPIYLPIYIAEFEETRPEGDRRFTIIIDAHDSNMNNCRASWPPPEEIYERSERFQTNYYVNPAPFLPTTSLVLPMIRSSPQSESPSTLNTVYSNWLSPAPSSSTSIPPSPLVDITDPVQWDDQRIQSWSGTEREENIEYTEKSLILWRGIAALEDLNQISGMDGKEQGVTVIGIDANGVGKKSVGEVKKQMEDNVEIMKAELVGLKPSWLVEWENKGL